MQPSTPYHKRLITRWAAATSAVAVVAVAVLAALPTSSVASVVPCPTSGLTVTVNRNPGHAAGTTYYKLRFKNRSGHSCTLSGFPGVSALDADGHQLGRAAAREPGRKVRIIILANGGTATAQLGIGTAAFYPSRACDRVTAAGLRVYPPNQAGSKFVRLTFTTCALHGPKILGIGPVTR